MPNKKTQRNGFYYYMQDMMPQLKRQGHTFPNGMADVVPVAHPKWKALSQAERDQYDQRAKQEKAKSRGSEGDRFRMDNTRTLISERRDPNDEMRQAVKEQRRYRQVMLNWRPGPSMLHEKLYFIDFTTMCRLEETEYWVPLEMAVVEYTMKDGILRTLHKFIDPGPIPLGYRFECQNKSDQFHQIPIEGFKIASSDYLGIWQSLEHFLNTNENAKDLPPLYALENRLAETNGCLLWLLHHSNLKYAQGARIRVHHLESMVYDLYRYAEQDHPPSEATIYGSMTTSAYDYQKDVVCTFHEELDCNRCALGRVKIYCFAISDCMASLYNFTPTSKHFPKPSLDSVSTVFEPKPIPAERHLRQQVQPAYRGKGARGRGYMPSRDPNDGQFGGRDIRQQRQDNFVPDRERFEDEFNMPAVPPTKLRQPTNPGIATQIPASRLLTSKTNNTLIHGAVHKEDPAFREPQQAPPPRQVIGEPVEDRAPTQSPWMKPEKKTSFDDDFPTLGAEGGPQRYAGRGALPPREISLGRGSITWGLASPGAAATTTFPAVGRGRAGVITSSSKVVPPPPGLIR